MRFQKFIRRCTMNFTAEHLFPRKYLNCLFVFYFPGLTTHCGCIFHSRVAGFSLLVFRGFLITHNDAPQSIGLLWTSNQLVAETSTWQHATLATDKHPCPPVGFEPTISAGERQKTYALDRAATGTGKSLTFTRRNCRHCLVTVLASHFLNPL